MKNISLFLVLSLVSLTTAQVVEFGRCRNYQTASGFNDEYIIKMAKEPNGFVAVLSSGDPHNCQSLKFSIGGYFEYSYIDGDNAIQKHTGTYSAKTATFTDPGFIDLNLPSGVLGSRLNGFSTSVRLNVLVAEEDSLVLASCAPFGVLRSEQIHGFVPSSKVTEESNAVMSEILELRGIPNVARLRALNHLCIPKAAPQSAGVLTSLFSGTSRRSDSANQAPSRIQTPVSPVSPEVAENVIQYSSLAQKNSFSAPIGYIPNVVQHSAYSAPISTANTAVKYSVPTVYTNPVPVGAGSPLLYNRFYY